MREIEKTDRTGCIFVLSSAVGIALCIWPAAWVYDTTGDVVMFVATYVMSTALFAIALTWTTLKALDASARSIEDEVLDIPYEKPKRIRRKIPVKKQGKVDYWVDMYTSEDTKALKEKQ